MRHEQIDPDPPCAKLGFCLTTDLTGNDRPDIIVGGAGEPFPGKDVIWDLHRQGYPTGRSLRSVVGMDETNLFWYENPGWERHDVAFVPHLDVGATLCDVTGDGRPNVVAGQGLGHTDIMWFEYPDDPRDEWTSHLVTNAFEKYHDVAAGDVDNDGEVELVGVSQESETVFYYDIPANPYQSPWPDANKHVIDRGREIEGLRIHDVDGDGRNELLAGTSIYSNGSADMDTHQTDGWTREDVVTGWDDTRVAVADLDDDGEAEIVFSEGDSPHLGTHPGRVAVFDIEDETKTVLEDDLFCPHTLQIADFNGDGIPDIYVAEMGLGENTEPRHLLFKNDGDGRFTRTLVESGVATHEATAVDMTGNGRPDIVGKSYGPDHHVDIWYNEG
jgi:hypothetical protein